MTPDIEDFHPSDNDVTLHSVSEADLDHSVSIPVEHERDTISEVDEENNSLVTPMTSSDNTPATSPEPEVKPEAEIEPEVVEIASETEVESEVEQVQTKEFFEILLRNILKNILCDTFKKTIT